MITLLLLTLLAFMALGIRSQLRAEREAIETFAGSGVEGNAHEGRRGYSNGQASLANRYGNKSAGELPGRRLSPRDHAAGIKPGLPANPFRK